MKDCCRSYYQVSRILDVPQAICEKYIPSALHAMNCKTPRGAKGISDSEFQLFKENFRIVRQISGRWTLKTNAQMELFND